MANLLENAMKKQVATNRAEKQAEEAKATEEKIKDIVSEYVQDAMESIQPPKQDEDELRAIVSACMQDAMKQNEVNTADQIQLAVNAAVRDALSSVNLAGADGQAVNLGENLDTARLQEQVDKIYSEITEQFQKQKEMIDAINNVSDDSKNFMTDIQNRMEQQTETSVRLVEEMQQKDSALMTIDYVAIKDNVTEFKEAIEACSQTMDQLRKQLNRERNNNDRTITELYRSMKYSEERVEELHSSYDEFTTVIASHKNIMGILVWLDIIIIAALIIFNLISLF